MLALLSCGAFRLHCGAALQAFSALVGRTGDARLCIRSDRSSCLLKRADISCCTRCCLGPLRKRSPSPARRPGHLHFQVVTPLRHAESQRLSYSSKSPCDEEFPIGTGPAPSCLLNLRPISRPHHTWQSIHVAARQAGRSAVLAPSSATPRRPYPARNGGCVAACRARPSMTRERLEKSPLTMSAEITPRFLAASPRSGTRGPGAAAASAPEKARGRAKVEHRGTE